MKLTYHSQQFSPALLDLLRATQPRYWKVIAGSFSLNDLQQVQDAVPGIRIIGRHYEPQEVVDQLAMGDDSPGLEAHWWVNCCLQESINPLIWAWETPNEPAQIDANEYAEFEAACVDLFTAAGKECLVNNVSTGRDGHWVAGARWYAAHEYGWSRVLSQESDHGLRYRSWFPGILDRNPDAVLFITEFGVTRAVVEYSPVGQDFGMGWQSDGRTVDDYWAESVKPYLNQLDRDEYVESAALFQAGGYAAWGSFEVLGTGFADLIRAGNMLPAPVPAPAHVAAPVETLGPTIRTLYRKQIDAWWRAGGWRNGALWLAATGQVEVSDSEFRTYVQDRVESSLNEARSYLSRTGDGEFRGLLERVLRGSL